MSGSCLETCDEDVQITFLSVLPNSKFNYDKDKKYEN